MKAANNAASAIAVLYKKNVLLAKRNKLCFLTGKPAVYGGYWSILGGTIDEGETPKECAVRELEEEAGICLDIKNVKFLKKIPEKKMDFFIHYCELDHMPDVELNEEHTEYGFFKIDSLLSFPYLIDSKIVKAVQEI